MNYSDLSLTQGQRGLALVYDTIRQLPSLPFASFPADKSALIVIDMINGFAKQGALSSPYIHELIPGIAELAGACKKAGMDCLAFTDAHTPQAVEFEAYPAHCIAGSWESQLVNELDAAAEFQMFYKNATNGFLNASFQKYLGSHPQTDHFILVGDCTDICVSQLAITLRAWYSENDRHSRVIVPVELVDTFDAPAHSRALWNAVALFEMMQNGVEVIQKIDVTQEGQHEPEFNNAD